MAGRGCLPVEKQSPTALVRMNELELTQSECSTSEQIVERNQKANPYSKTTEYEKEKGSLLQETTNSQGSTNISIERTLNTFTQFEERKYERLLNKGDLIEFSPYHYHSFTILNPPSYHDDEESIVHKDVDSKAHSHCAVYIGSGTIEGPNTPYCVKEFTDIPLTDPTKRTIKVVYTTNEQDNIKSIVRVGEPIQVAKVENAEPYQSNPMNEMSNSTKSSIERTVNTCTQFDERKYEQVLNKGDLFEFHPCHSFMSRYPPYSHPDDEESIVHKDVDSKARSHWAVYLGSGTIEGPNTHYCIIAQREMQDTKLTKITLIVSYPTEEQNKTIDRYLKDSDELKTIVRIGDLLQIAKVQKAKPCQNIQMDKICKLKGKEQSKHIDSTIKMFVMMDDLEVQIAEQNSQMNEISELKPVYSTKEKDKDTDIKLTYSDELKMIVTTDDPEVQIAEPYQNSQMNEISELKPVYSTKEKDKDTDIKLTDSDELKMIVTTDDPEVQIAEPYQNSQMNVISELKPVYSTKEKDKDIDIKLTDSDELKMIVTTDDPEVQIAEPYQNSQMNEISELKPVYSTKEKDKDTDITLTDSDELKMIVTTDDPEVQIAEPYQNNPMNEMLNSTKTSVGRTVNTCTELDETTNEEKFKEGDLIQFRPYHSRTIRYPPYSHPDNTENIVREEVRGKVKSHWAVYLGSGKVAHVAGPNTPYCVKVLREIQTANQRMCLIKAVYPTTVQANIDLDLKDSDALKPIVRIDELLQVAKVQNAEPCKNNKMDKKYFAGTPTEIVNIAKHLVGISLPHDFITKDCKDFAFFCRYGENLRSLKETQQHEHSTNKIMCMGILGVAIAFVALKMSKLL